MLQRLHSWRATVGLLVLLPTAAAQNYTLVDLGTFGGELANALGINDQGVIVGQAEAPNFNTQAFVWQNGVMTVVPGLNPDNSGRADGINSSGHVAGSSMAPYPAGPGWVGHASFWSPATGAVDLTPTSTASSQAMAINDAGQIVGHLGGPAGGARMWTVNALGQVTTTPIAMAGAPAGFSNEATDINASGTVVGVGYNASFQYRAWKWTGSGDAVELPNLGGVQTIAEGINDAGEICGSAQLPSGQRVPVKWLPNGTIQQLGLLPLPNVIGTEARGINNLGDVVGAELYIDPVTTLGAVEPWVWSNGTKQALNDLLTPADRLEWNLQWAIDINDASQIVGIAIRTIGGIEYPGRAFLLDLGGAVGTPICFGDGTGTQCPCGNTGASGAGCANSSGVGATLAGSGSASVAANNLALSAEAQTPNQPALLFAGANAVNGGAGVPFGDGLRCAGGDLKRLGVRQSNAQGAATWGPNLNATWSAGDTRHFQTWYRDPLASPCGTGFNLSHAVSVTFAP